MALSLSVLATSAFATYLLVGGEADVGDSWMHLVTVGLFSLLFAWVGAGFVTALMGFAVSLRGDRFALGRPEHGTPIAQDARTAIIMPICNEDVSTVFAGLRATMHSVASTGALKLFDLYILSDTSKPEVRAAEQRAWQQLREELGDTGEGHVFYRWRRVRRKRKAGNVADFCRRWGRNYRYMVVLDADSVMSGDCLVSLVRLMEANPRAGIVQSAPRVCGHDSLHARSQQFASRVMGRLFAMGLSYWQMGESHYWGHNAILRVEPFMKHCALAKLPGRGGLSGEILSHDFVEAALMRRAGYEVWLAPELDGSYEQQPPNLIEELGRDRRWCQGNLQNARLIAEPGLQPVHRAMFATGAMAYLASPLWMIFVVLGIAYALGHAPAETMAVVTSPAALTLWAATLVMLLLPRVLGVLLVVLRGEQREFGGTVKLALGALTETVLSVLQAPVRMVAHTIFVVGALTGLKLDWKSPARDANAMGWRDAARVLGLTAALAVAALAAIASAGHDVLALRVAPLLVPLALAIPMAVWTSRTSTGQWLRRRGMLLIPEEVLPPPLLRLATASKTEAATQASYEVARPAPALTHQPAVVLQPAVARARPVGGMASLRRAATIAAGLAIPVTTPFVPSAILTAQAPVHHWIASVPAMTESVPQFIASDVFVPDVDLNTIGMTSDTGIDSEPAVKTRATGRRASRS